LPRRVFEVVERFQTLFHGKVVFKTVQLQKDRKQVSIWRLRRTGLSKLRKGCR
jgi:hypothetical protein